MADYTDTSLPPVGKPAIIHRDACPLCGAAADAPRLDTSLLIPAQPPGPPRIEFFQPLTVQQPMPPPDPFAEPWGPPAVTITLPDDPTLPPPDAGQAARPAPPAPLRVNPPVPELILSPELQQVPGIATTAPGNTTFQPGTAVGPTENDPALFDHPLIGGKFTIFVLLYGDFPNLHRQCLQSLIGTIPAGRMELRVGSNELCQETQTYLNELASQGLLAAHYRHPGNDKKYPVMREMFHDPSRPIRTRWCMWFDDDSLCTKDRMWVYHLARFLTRHPRAGMVGCRFINTIQAGQARWLRSRPWYRGKPFRTSHGQPAANGDKILFATGGWWCLLSEAISKAQVPDAQLGHNLGDITIGEQIYQNGYELLDWNRNKEFVFTSSHPRRGITDAPPWAR